jgi:hypothetical protein
MVILNSKFNRDIPEFSFSITLGHMFFSEISFFGLTFPLLGGGGGGGVRPSALKKFTDPVQFLTSRAPLESESAWDLN